MTVFDQSHKDMKYFINDKVYNCPFCNRRNVSYVVKDRGCFDSSNNKSVYFYIVECEDEDCRKRSFHLSNYEIALYERYEDSEQSFYFPPERKRPVLESKKDMMSGYEDITDNGGSPITELDDLLYYNDPSSFFTIDKRVPVLIREPLNESYRCLKSNLITGASAGLRKAIYKLLKHENIAEENGKGGYNNHDERIELLKLKYKDIEPELLDELKAVHSLTSQELHENDWVDFDGSTIRFLIEVIKEVLMHIYILPDEKNKRRSELSSLRSKAKNNLKK
ncbi:TPA: hypothetical protein JBJ04_13205 [Legionella pneumophila]|nr:hypothetical protein [Legionella pneumophila]